MKNYVYLTQSNPMGTWDLLTGAILALEVNSNDENDDDVLNDRFKALADRLGIELGLHECDCCWPRWHLPFEFEVLSTEGLNKLLDKKQQMFKDRFLSGDEVDPVLARIYEMDGSEIVVHFQSSTSSLS